MIFYFDLVFDDEMIDSKLVAVFCDRPFVVAALSDMRLHDDMRLFEIRAGVDYFVDFFRAVTWLHIHEVGVGFGLRVACPAEEARTCHRQSRRAQAVKRQAGATSGHDMVDMAGVAIQVQAHELDFDIFTAGHGFFDQVGEPIGNFEVVEVV